MVVQFTTRRGEPIIINLDKILFASMNGKYTRIELDDGTPIDVLETLEEVCAICQVKNSKENTKI